MIEPAFDDKGRLLWVSLVPPLTVSEHDALYATLVRWKDHPLPEVEIVLLQGRFEPDIEDTP
jgi:hypothetical protein